MTKKIRCAIYTRKSSEDGLEQEFNSLHAQREACAAYITSQKAEGWVLLPELYDDGGISGATLDRPSLQCLLSELDEGRVDQIVVYKIDRLSRSLSDFARIVDRLDGAGASFVSITQSFNTATSMGRLTLNMLLSFAQFEREVTAERIRDKIAASKRKGLWMGGNVPLGYDPNGRTLTINESEAETVRAIYRMYHTHKTTFEVTTEAKRKGLRSKRRTTPSGEIKGGNVIDRGHIYHILTNPIYAGRIRHKKAVFEGQHPAIIDPQDWDEIQRKLSNRSGRKRGVRVAAHPSPLAGKLFDETGDRLTPSHSSKDGKRLRYYISRRLATGKSREHPDAWRLPAPQLEQSIARVVHSHLADPAILPKLLGKIDATKLDLLQAKTNLLADTVAPHQTTSKWSALIYLATIAPGKLVVELNGEAISHQLDVPEDHIEANHLRLNAAFQLRRKGVETKIILGCEPPEVDEVLVRNIVKSRNWFEAIKRGETFATIAAREGTSKRRIQDVVDLAFLAPDILADVVAGTLPMNVTSDVLIKQGIPGRWSEQRLLFKENPIRSNAA
ncbi:recombinase family protein [Rhodobacteraceae bacterium nBUS_22]|tara:strand:+ start:27710 stop:29383 length:1674 start_codon:yes stop_codon:yes gene_type:complete